MMQTPHKASTKAIALFISLHYLCIQASSVDTLKQGEILNSTSELASANGIFTLKFHNPQNTNNTYIAIWFKDRNRSVWIGNRENPIPSNSSPALTVGIRGELSITHGGGDSVQIYAGGSGQNVTARLLNTGNLVLTSDESSGILWQSFDHPTDTLLPGMKLGKTGTNSTLSSWLTTNNPASGPFTLEWDPSSRNFLVRRKGDVYWRSGKLKYYSDENGTVRVDLENFSWTRDPSYFYYNFTSIRSDEEDYLILSLLPRPYLYENAVISGWQLEFEGDITDINSFRVIATPSHCYNYSNDKSAVIKGCEPREQPKCRNERHRFVLKSGDFWPDRGQLEGVNDTTNSNLSLSDCQEVCWKDCDCVAYRGRDGSGCIYWKGKNLVYRQSVDGTVVRKYFLEIAPSSKGGGAQTKIPYRCNIQFVEMNITSLELREDHKLELQKTPFWLFLQTIFNGKIVPNNCKKSDDEIREIVKCYNKTHKDFLFGRALIKPNKDDVRLIFGVRGGDKEIVIEKINYQETEFLRQCFSDRATSPQLTLLQLLQKASIKLVKEKPRTTFRIIVSSLKFTIKMQPRSIAPV